MIPYGTHDIRDEDIDAVTTVLKEEFLTQGKQVPAFERALCDYTGAGHAVCVNSGTSALHIACLAAGVKPGSLVWTSPNSFAASANCARYCGAEVDFVDIDSATRNMSVATLKRKLADAKVAGQLPDVLIVVHFAGSSCDMEAIASLTRQYKITLIEDAAHALGGRDAQSNRIGRCAYSDMAILSFHPVKSITSAEGGAVTTNNDEFARLLRLFASHGITRDPDVMPHGHSDEPWFYAQMELGYNYRLSDLHAALGKSQLSRLDAYITARRERAKVYQQALADLPIKLPEWDAYSGWHLYVIELLQHDRTSIFTALRERGIGVNVHYIPIHTHPYYASLGFSEGDFVTAETYYSRAISLPLFPSLSRSDQEVVISALRELLL